MPQICCAGFPTHVTLVERLDVHVAALTVSELIQCTLRSFGYCSADLVCLLTSSSPSTFSLMYHLHWQCIVGWLIHVLYELN